VRCEGLGVKNRQLNELWQRTGINEWLSWAELENAKQQKKKIF
jgi:hypothetical protein